MITFRDLIGKESAKLYCVMSDNSNVVSEFEVAVLDYQTAFNRGYVWRYTVPPLCFIFRLSQNKRALYSPWDGHRTITDFSTSIRNIDLYEADLDKSSLVRQKIRIFCNKEDACDLILKMLKERKRKLNNYIIRASNLKYKVE